MILVPRMQDATEVGLHVGAEQRAAVEHARDLLQPLADLNAIDRRGDRRERADHVGHGEALLKRLIPLGIEIVGGSHAAGHPQQDDRIRLGLWVLDRLACGAGPRPWFRQRKCRCCGSGEALEEIASASHSSGLHYRIN